MAKALCRGPRRALYGLEQNNIYETYECTSHTTILYSALYQCASITVDKIINFCAIKGSLESLCIFGSKSEFQCDEQGQEKHFGCY